MKIETKFGDWGYVHHDDARGKGHWQMLSTVPNGSRVFTVLYSTHGARMIQTREEEDGTLATRTGPWHVVEYATEEGAITALLRQEHMLQPLPPEQVGPTQGNLTVRQLHRVTSQLMAEDPDAEVLISVDVSTDDTDPLRRAFSTHYFHHQKNAPRGNVGEYSLLFGGYVNTEEVQDYITEGD